MKGAKDSSIVVNISRDTIVNVEEIDDITLEEDEQDVPELETAVNVCFIVSLGPLICILSGQSIADPDLYSRIHFQKLLRRQLQLRRSFLMLKRTWLMVICTSRRRCCPPV